MNRAGILIVLGWAVIAAPLLCVAGVLQHDCPCAEESSCEHELDCGSDPCSEMVLRRDDSGACLGAVPLAAFLSALPDWAGPARATTPPVQTGIPRSLVGPHSSDRPLLI
jgi:hypothetical protein